MAVAIRTITRLQDADDVNVSLGAGVDGYALTWDNATSAFVAMPLSAGVTDHGALTGLTDDDHSQYLLATGARTGASSQAQAFTNGIIGPTWKPASDATDALKLTNAAGTAVVTVDTTNSMVGIGTTAPGAKLEVSPVINTSDESNCIQSFFRNNGTGNIIGLRLLPQSWHSSGTRNKAVAIETGIWQVGGGSLSDAICIDVTGLSLFAGAVGNLYGLRIKGISGGSGTNYAIHADSGLNYLAGAVGVGIETPTALIHGLLTNATTNAVSNVLTLGHDTSGTAANGFGAGLLYQLESSTTAAQNAARIQVLWNDATHATRKADLVLTAYDTAEREGLRIRGAGSAAAIGFYGVTPIERAVLATGAGASVDDVITALQNLGLVKQS